MAAEDSRDVGKDWREADPPLIDSRGRFLKPAPQAVIAAGFGACPS